MPTNFRRLALGSALTLALAAAASLPLRAEIIEQVLVKVNGEIFTKTDLEQRQVLALRAQNRNVKAEDIKGDEDLRKMLNEVTPDVLGDAIDELLLLQRGKELGFSLSDEQFSQIVANIRKENKLENEEQFLAALKQEGLTLPDLRRSIERQMIVNRVQQQDVMDKISVTEAESAAYFAAHKDQFSTPAAVTLREILVAVPDRAPAGTAEAGQAGFNVGLDEEAKIKAEALRHRITAGEDFAALAAANSDAPSKANGGLIGPVNPDEMSPQLLAVVKGLKVGEMHAADPQPARLPDHQARDPQRDRRPAARSRPQSGRRPRLPREGQAGAGEVPPEAARSGHHRVEERRSEEGLRGLPGEAGRADLQLELSS